MPKKATVDNDLYLTETTNKWPIFYRPEYNLHIFGLETLHPFDAGKWGGIFKILKERGLLDENSVISPREILKNDLLVAHSRDYLESLPLRSVAVHIFEVTFMSFLPSAVIEKRVLQPMRYQVGGSLAAGRLALDRGWAINIGGGFHHASRHRGGGFCAYADISLITLTLLNNDPRVKSVMIVDLDAHQGNGHERDFGQYEEVFIMDVYNASIYPRDYFARSFIRCDVQLEPQTQDEEYLEKVESNLEESLRNFQADLIIYNAGTDVLAGDRLGLLAVSERGRNNYLHVSSAFRVIADLFPVENIVIK